VIGAGGDDAAAGDGVAVDRGHHRPPVGKEVVEGARQGRDELGDVVGPAVVRRVARLVDRSEYKRRQAPPGVRVSPKAFGKDRRLPITNGWAG